MRTPSWIRETLEGYRWLWRAQLRWGAGSRWLAPVRFAWQVADDLLDAALSALADPVLFLRPIPAGPSPRRTPMTVSAAVLYDTSANNRFKARFDSWLWMSMVAAVFIHFSVFALWPELTPTDISTITRTLEDIPLPPDVEIPPPPEPLARPALPVVASTDIPPDVTIASTDWDANPVSTLAPPPDQIETDVSGPSGFTPYTVAPAVLNTDEVVRAMQREYPTVLRDAGIGGTVKVNFHIDEEGRVLETRLGEGSSYPALNEAAMSVADVVRFRPAMNRDKRVAVWVEFPIVFRVDGRQGL